MRGEDRRGLRLVYYILLSCLHRAGTGQSSRNGNRESGILRNCYEGEKNCFHYNRATASITKPEESSIINLNVFVVPQCPLCLARLLSFD